MKDAFAHGRASCCSCSPGFVFYHPELIWATPTTTSVAEPAEDAGAYRARMVLPAVLCDPARNHLQHRADRFQARSACSRCSARSRCCAFVPWLDTSKVRSARSTVRWYKLFFWALRRHMPSCLDGWARESGGRHLCRPVADRHASTTSPFFLIIMPVLGLIETPLAVPAEFDHGSGCLRRTRARPPRIRWVRLPHRTPKAELSVKRILR